MPPYFGQALNMALEDAAILAQRLTKSDDAIGSIVPKYAASRIGEARACQDMTAFQREWLFEHSKSPLKRLRQRYQQYMHWLLPSIYCPTARAMVNHHHMS